MQSGPVSLQQLGPADPEAGPVASGVRVRMARQGCVVYPLSQGGGDSSASMRPPGTASLHL